MSRTPPRPDSPDGLGELDLFGEEATRVEGFRVQKPRIEAERWERVQELFLEALEEAPDDLGAWLDEVCGEDRELRREVASLLDHSDEADERIENAISRAIADSGIEGGGEQERKRIGHYRILREIGRGGLSTVYLAERSDDQYRMQVAIKLVRRGLDTRDILQRMRQERQILASLNHPNIARLLDGGETEDGLPYFVMEHIPGEHVDVYCRRAGLSLHQRLRLFRDVCSAVQHAHQNLVVHSDLKPSNLLVTQDGTPKLLDFGIAKLLDPEQHPHTYAPSTPGMRLLTPEYASPEQVRGEKLSTSTDVYSLGMILYLLLTGELPYHFESRQPQIIEKTVCETEPERPSQVVLGFGAGEGGGGEAADLCGETPTRLARRLRGDLDNIVLKALRKESRRRYGSVEQFSEDIRRYLEFEPVLARPDSVRYRLGKFGKRHRTGVAAASLVSLALLGGMAGTLWQARIAERQRAEAEQQRSRAERSKGFLIDLFKVVDPSEARGHKVTAEEVLRSGAERIQRELVDLPEDRADLLDMIGQVYYNLGLYEESQGQLEEALEVRRQVHGPEHAEVASTQNQLAEVLGERGEYERAEELLQETLELRRRLYGGDHPMVADTLNDLGALRVRRGEYETAESYLLEGLEMRVGTLGSRHPDVAESFNNLAVLHYGEGDIAAAEDKLQRALEIRSERLGNEHPETVTTENNLAAVLLAQGEYSRAEPLFRQVLAARRKLLPAEHPAIAESLSNIATTLRARRQYQEAEPLLRESLAQTRKFQEADHPSLATIQVNLAVVVQALGQTEDAERLYREALEHRQRHLPEGAWQVAFPALRLGEILAESGRPGEGETLVREAVELLRTSVGAEHWRTADGESALGACLTALGRYAEAEALLLHALPLLEENREILEARLQFDEVAKARERLAALYDLLGRGEEAERIRRSGPAPA